MSAQKSSPVVLSESEDVLDLSMTSITGPTQEDVEHLTVEAEIHPEPRLNETMRVSMEVTQPQPDTSNNSPQFPPGFGGFTQHMSYK